MAYIVESYQEYLVVSQSEKFSKSYYLTSDISKATVFETESEAKSALKISGYNAKPIKIEG